jgi:hypothetical protein
MFIPLFLAAVTWARSGGDQYSSCPSENSALAPSSRCASASMSWLVVYASGMSRRSASSMTFRSWNRNMNAPIRSYGRSRLTASERLP